METNAFWQLAEWHHPWLATPINPAFDTCSGCIYESSPARVVGFNTDYSYYYEQLPAEAYQAWAPPVMSSPPSSLGEQLRTLKPIKIAKRSNRGKGRRRNASQAEQEVGYACATPNQLAVEGEVAYGCPTGCPTVAAGLLSHIMKAEQCRDSSPAPAPADAALDAAPEGPTQPIPTPKQRRGSADNSPNSAGGFPATPSAPSSPWGSNGTPPRKAVSLFEQLDEAHAAASSAQEQVCSLQQELSKERQEVAALQQQLRLLTVEKERLLAERAAAPAVPTSEARPSGGAGAAAGTRSRRRRRSGRKAGGSASNDNSNSQALGAAAAARA